MFGSKVVTHVDHVAKSEDKRMPPARRGDENGCIAAGKYQRARTPSRMLKRMWAIRQRKLLGFCLFFGCLLLGAGAAAILLPFVHVEPVGLGMLVGGVLVCVGDVLMRTFGGEGTGIMRYLAWRAGPTLRGTLAWLLGLIVLAGGIAVMAKVR